MEIKSTRANTGGSVLSRIIGARLTSVNFVLDYLILGFDEKGALTSLVWPEVFIAGSVLKFGMQGYTDRLCELISQDFSGVHCSEMRPYDFVRRQVPSNSPAAAASAG
jgi:hypothetical protein